MTRSRNNRRRHTPHRSDLGHGGNGSSSPRPQNKVMKAGMKTELTPYMAARARELKEEGNRRFQERDYAGAMEVYEFALSLVPHGHPERAVLHSNRAACLMQMKPARYNDAAHECSLALHAQPGFPRALLRRARAFEAMAKLDLALSDLNHLLLQDPSHPDAIDMDARIRHALSQQQQQQCKTQERLSVGASSAEDAAAHDPTHPCSTPFKSSSCSSSDAAVDSANSASQLVVQRSETREAAAIIEEHRDEAPAIAEIAPEKTHHATTTKIADEQTESRVSAASELTGNNLSILSASRPRDLIVEDISTDTAAFADENGMVFTPCPSSRVIRTSPLPDTSPSHDDMPSMAADETMPVSPVIQQSQLSDSTSSAKLEPSRPGSSSEKIIQLETVRDVLQIETDPSSTTPQLRPLKLVYDHDIRLAVMPAGCTFGELRKIVKDRFPSSKALLIKYKDVEGDLVTITSTKELRLAESAAAFEAAGRSLRLAMPPPPSSSDSAAASQNGANPAIGLPLVASVLDQIRLHLVEVPPEQEPHDKEDVSSIETKESIAMENGGKRGGILQRELAAMEAAAVSTKESELKEEWLTDFANLFCAHLGIDPKGGHVDLREWGMERCAEVLEEMVVSSEEAHKVLETRVIEKLRRAVASGLLSWGNVYMWTARKQRQQQPPPAFKEEEAMDVCYYSRSLQETFRWAETQYALAEEKFEQCLQVKPDSCEALLGLAHKDFESAKLHWTLAVATQTELRTWDSSQMQKLFYSAEERMRRAACVVEAATSVQQEGQCAAADSHDKEEASLQQQQQEVYLVWGDILYEHSQVGLRLGLPCWEQLLDDAVGKYEAAGASSSEIAIALEKHHSRSDPAAAAAAGK